MAGLINALARLWRRPARVPYLPQMEAAECGVACLAMVLRSFGASYTLAELRARCDVGRDGVSAAKLFRAAQSLGLVVKATRVDLAGLTRQAFPAIAHWEFNHFVVVTGIDQHGATVVDPATGERHVSNAELSRAFTGVLLTFARGEQFQERKVRSESVARVLDTLTGLRHAGATLLALVLVMEVLSLLLPTASQVLIDHVLTPQRDSWLAVVLIATGLGTLGVLVATALRDRLVQRLHFAADLELGTAFVERLIRLPLGFFELRSAGDLMQRIDAQRDVRDLILRGLTALLDGVLLLGYGALMLAYDLGVGAAILALAGLRTAVVLSTSRAVRHASASHLAAHGREQQVVVEALASPELTRAFSLEPLLEERYDGKLVERLNSDLRKRTVSERARQLSSVADGLAHAALLCLAGVQVLDDRMTLGVFTGLLTLQGLFQKPLGALIDSFSVLEYARAVLARLDDVFAERVPQPGTVKRGRAQGALTLERVSFRYPGQTTPMTQALDVHVRAGEKVALVGRSGHGKSTLLRLAAGLIAPTEGRVLLDGEPLAERCTEELASQVGIVLQDPLLFDGSVRENLTLSVPDADEASVREAARMACIDERIARLPDGYETQLGDNAGRFSGGERQRLALARALVKKPRLLLLDEATSALDLATERQVHQNLSACGVTRILVAHRLETVRDADRILVIEGGKVVQEGTFEQLSATPGLFAALVESAPARQPC
jgi:ATP-binding cassette, subfamily B, bacterial